MWITSDHKLKVKCHHCKESFDVCFDMKPKFLGTEWDSETHGWKKRRKK